jgi:hypothetical protein
MLSSNHDHKFICSSWVLHILTRINSEDDDETVDVGAADDDDNNVVKEKKNPNYFVFFSLKKNKKSLRKGLIVRSLLVIYP